MDTKHAIQVLEQRAAALHMQAQALNKEGKYEGGICGVYCGSWHACFTAML